MHNSSPSDGVLHVFLTRFNVVTGGREQRLRQRDGWLAGRFELFDQFCFPSMRAQTRQDFVWLVFFDHETPDEFKQRIAECAAWSNFQPVWVDQWNHSVVEHAINARIRPHHEWLLTSRLDNDDGIHTRFVETLRENAAPGRIGFYNFSNGLIYRNGCIYEHVDLSNAFASFLEPVKDYRTAWQIQHHELHKAGQVYQLPLPHAWFQVVHGGNVSNRVKGRRIPHAYWAAAYPQFAGLNRASESAAAFAFDRFVGRPYRVCRENLIRLVKPLIRRQPVRK